MYTSSLLARCIVCTLAFASAAYARDQQSSGLTGNGPILVKEFIYENAPFPSCHASTVAEAGEGLLAAWFGGTDEGEPDVGIWLSRRDSSGWSAPVEVAAGLVDGGKRYPCWNPVLFQPKGGPLLLFYKVGPSPSKWWGMLMTSQDGGKSWSQPHRLPDGILGPIKNKPVQLPSGEILCPSSSEHDGWRVHFERTADFGQTWERTGAVNDGKQFSAIQPSILLHGKDQLQALGRTRQGKIFEIWSSDGGKTWGSMSATSLPNPNAGTDAVTLKNGKHVLVYNHTPKGRTPLNVALSSDGKTWTPLVVLENEPGEFSYPAVIQSADGKVHITYTWKRKRIRYVMLDPETLSK